MKKLLLLAVLVGFSSSVVFAGDVGVKISNVKSTKGEMVFAVLEGEAGYKDQSNPKFSGRMSVGQKQNGFVIENVPAGEYVIVIYQDENKNGKLDMGMFGPKEPYGFSRNPKIRFGPPKYQDVVFKVDAKKPSALDIKLK